MKTTYKTISSRARRMLNSSEDFEIEFKQSLSSFNADSIVSFANSNRGGTILIGVKEVKTLKGKQKGKVIGCKTGDEEKMVILGKAQSCFPSVEISIILENESKKSFYRVEIPSGNSKPYCTSGGTYKLRDDGNKKPMFPDDLLKVFLNEESGKFLSKFRESTLELRKEIDDKNNEIISRLKDSIETSKNIYESLLSKFYEGIYELSRDLQLTEEDINLNLENLIDQSEINGSNIDYVTKEIQEESMVTSHRVKALEEKVDAILNHFEIEDPIIVKEKKKLEVLISINKAEYFAIKKKVTLREIKKEHKKISNFSLLARGYNIEEFRKVWDQTEINETILELMKKRNKSSR